MVSEEVHALLVRAQRSLEEGRFEDAKEAIREGYARAPEDEKVRDFYQQILLADGVRLSRRARDLRRDEIRALPRKQRGAYRDSPEVSAAFQVALASLDDALEADARNAKALMLKAGVLDRMDREGMQSEVEALFERALEVHPGNEELIYARDRILLACPRCAHTGICPACQGAGEVSALFVRSPCPECKGTGICGHCGLF